MLKKQICSKWNKLKVWWWRQRLVVDKPTHAPWCILKHKKECPVCGENVFAMRVVLGEDMAQVSPESVHPTVIYAIVGNEYLHSNSKYCAERMMKYKKLEARKLKVVREPKPEGGYKEDD